MDLIHILDSHISALASIPEEKKCEFFEQVYIRKYAKDEFLVQEQSPCDRLFFVAQGLLCSIISDNLSGSSVVHFAFENTVLTDLRGFLTETQSQTAIKALEETHCIVIPRSAVNWLYQHVEEGNKIGRSLYQAFYGRLAKLNKLNHLRKPRDRYMMMLRIYPGIENRVTQRYLSSFIRVDPAYFTRMRLKNLV